MGHMDQQLALKWISQNAAAFGGDPTRVTLWGASSSAASVGFHLLSPGSEPYFQNVVMESGSPLRCATDFNFTDSHITRTPLRTLVRAPAPFGSSRVPCTYNVLGTPCHIALM